MNCLISVAPRAQLSPIHRGLKCISDVTIASTVCPDKVRPLRSTTVPEICGMYWFSGKNYFRLTMAINCLKYMLVPCPLKIDTFTTPPTFKTLKFHNFLFFLKIGYNSVILRHNSIFDNDRSLILVPENIYWGLSCRLWIILELPT